MMLYKNSYDHQETNSLILVNKIAESFFGAKGKKKKKSNNPPRKLIGDKPDIEKFEKIYGNRIKRPNKD